MRGAIYIKGSDLSGTSVACLYSVTVVLRCFMVLPRIHKAVVIKKKRAMFKQ